MFTRLLFSFRIQGDNNPTILLSSDLFFTLRILGFKDIIIPLYSDSLQNHTFMGDYSKNYTFIGE